MFEGAIADLHTTVVTSLLHDNEFHAGLAIDIMDRNLYERANDCRWWALTTAFSEPLSRGQLTDQDRSAVGAILRTINGLYTVYSNLILFDRVRRRSLRVQSGRRTDLPARCSATNGFRASCR